MSLQCEEARPLIGSYADGELTEAQATPLRQHLMSCAACRVLVQDQKALERWFAPSPTVEVPAGFAERVARRAFAGDRGETSVTAGTEADSAGIESFLFRLASLAAAAAILFAVMIQQQSRPSTDSMKAGENAPSLEELRRELDQLNAAEPLVDEQDSADTNR